MYVSFKCWNSFLIHVDKMLQINYINVQVEIKMFQNGNIYIKQLSITYSVK